MYGAPLGSASHGLASSTVASGMITKSLSATWRSLFSIWAAPAFAFARSLRTAESIAWMNRGGFATVLASVSRVPTLREELRFRSIVFLPIGQERQPRSVREKSVSCARGIEVWSFGV